MQLNAQDLFVRLAYPVGPRDLEVLSESQWQQLGETDLPLKPLGKLSALARVIDELRPDVVCLNEVGGPESLVEVTRLFLADAYLPYIARGNDERGIDNGFLLRKGLGLKARLVSHRDWPLPFTYLFEDDPVAYFVTAELAKAYDLGTPEARKLSRDVPELRLSRPGAAAPFLTLLSVHAKSMRDAEGVDPRGQTRRGAEIRAVTEIYQAIKAELGAAHPIVVAGDFNTNASEVDTAPEARILYEATPLRDVLALTAREPHERITQLSYFRNDISATQLDYVFLSPELQPALDHARSRVYRYRFEEDAKEMQLPLNFRERGALPSDHYPVICVVDVPT
jgi:hypothetical protein